MERDPVCGMELDEHMAEETSEYKGREYYFCSRMCREKFESNPERYAGQRAGGA